MTPLLKHSFLYPQKFPMITDINLINILFFRRPFLKSIYLLIHIKNLLSLLIDFPFLRIDLDFKFFDLRLKMLIFMRLLFQNAFLLVVHIGINRLRNNFFDFQSVDLSLLPLSSFHLLLSKVHHSLSHLKNFLKILFQFNDMGRINRLVHFR